MDFFLEFALRIGIFLVLVFIARLIFVKYNKYKRERLTSGIPDYSKIKEIKTFIREQQNQKISYQTILANLKKTYGIKKDYSRQLIIDIEKEAPANINELNIEKKRNYIIHYPKNWEITPLDSSLDQDKFFALSGSFGLTIAFTLFDNNSDISFKHNSILNDLKNDFNDFNITGSVNSWGNFNGTGTLFKASERSYPLHGLLFTYLHGENSFYFIQTTFDEDYENVESGMEIVRNCFSLEQEI